MALKIEDTLSSQLLYLGNLANHEILILEIFMLASYMVQYFQIFTWNNYLNYCSYMFVSLATINVISFQFV